MCHRRNPVSRICKGFEGISQVGLLGFLKGALNLAHMGYPATLPVEDKH